MLRTMAKNYPYVPFGLGWKTEDGALPVDAGADKAAAQTAGSEAPVSEPPQVDISDAPIRLLEEYHYDEDAVDVDCPPYAYVADYVVKVQAGVNVTEEMRKYAELPVKGEEGWLEKLMSGVRVFGEDTGDMGWWIVVCDDEERDAGWDEDDENHENDENEDEDEDETDEGQEATPQPTISSKEQGQVTEAKEQERTNEAGEEKGFKSRLKKVLPLRKKEK
jgi:hypothetical protein